MRITIVLATTILLSGIFLGSCGVILAQDDNIGQSLIYPASPFYFLKTIRESLELKFAGTTNIRTLRQLEFSTRRIREVKSLISANHQDLIEPTLERYWIHLRELLGIANLKDSDLANRIIEGTSLHLNVLINVYERVENKRAKMAIRSVVNRISIWDQDLIVRLNKIDQTRFAQQVETSKMQACNFLTKEASTSTTLSAGFSGLNDVEKVTLSERAQKCQKIH